jgi:hypothetical protein
MGSAGIGSGDRSIAGMASILPKESIRASKITGAVL